MASYSKLSDKDLEDFSDFYQLEISGCKPMPQGQCNSNYLLDTTGGKFILTIVEELDFRHTVDLTNLLDWLRERGITCPDVRDGKDGNRVGDFAGKPVYVKSFVEGTVPVVIDLKLMGEIGAGMAKLHSVESPPWLSKELYFEEERFREFIGSGVEPQFESWLSARLVEGEALKERALPTGMIHGDVFSDNVLVENGVLKAIIDFEEVCFREFVFDLGMAIVGMCKVDNRIDLARAAALVEGYEGVRELTEDEKGSLRECVVYAAAGTSSWRFWKFRLADEDESKRDSYLELVGLADWVKSLIEGEFRESVFGAKALPGV